MLTIWLPWKRIAVFISLLTAKCHVKIMPSTFREVIQTGQWKLLWLDISLLSQTSHLIDSLYMVSIDVLQKKRNALTLAPARSSCPNGEYFLGSEADPSQGYAIDNLGPGYPASLSGVFNHWGCLRHFLTGGLTAHENYSLPLSFRNLPETSLFDCV